MPDPLTGIAKRRAFLHMAQTEIDRSRRYNHPFSVMVMDIDKFKQMNDYFGHHFCDRLLKTVVETIETTDKLMYQAKQNGKNIFRSVV